jgi:hypothetical protein
VQQARTSSSAPPVTRSKRLWVGILAAPLAWTVDLLLSYALVGPACQTRAPLMLNAVWVVSLLIAIGGGLICWQVRAQPQDPHRRNGVVQLDRVDFMAEGGMLISALFAIIILLAGLANLVLSPCWY